MQIKKYLFFHAIVFGLISSGCSKPELYDITDIRIANMDNSGGYAVLTDSSVLQTAYVMQLQFIGDSLVRNNSNQDQEFATRNPPESILITSTANFDAAHPAGNSLNDIFIEGPDLNSTADDIITKFNVAQHTDGPHPPMELWMMKVPAISGTYRFVVDLGLKGGTHVRDTTTVILHP